MPASLGHRLPPVVRPSWERAAGDTGLRPRAWGPLSWPISKPSRAGSRSDWPVPQSRTAHRRSAQRLVSLARPASHIDPPGISEARSEGEQDFAPFLTELIVLQGNGQTGSRRQCAVSSGEPWAPSATGPTPSPTPQRHTHRTRSGARSEALDTGGRRWPHITAPAPRTSSHGPRPALTQRVHQNEGHREQPCVPLRANGKPKEAQTEVG